LSPVPIFALPLLVDSVGYFGQPIRAPRALYHFCEGKELNPVFRRTPQRMQMSLRNEIGDVARMAVKQTCNLFHGQTDRRLLQEAEKPILIVAHNFTVFGRAAAARLCARAARSKETSRSPAKNTQTVFANVQRLKDVHRASASPTGRPSARRSVHNDCGAMHATQECRTTNAKAECKSRCRWGSNPLSSPSSNESSHPSYPGVPTEPPISAEVADYWRTSARGRPRFASLHPEQVSRGEQRRHFSGDAFPPVRVKKAFVEKPVEPLRDGAFQAFEEIEVDAFQIASPEAPIDDVVPNEAGTRRR